MPDAYENINMAMRSMLTTSVIADSEDPYFQFNDLTLMGSTGVLSPFSSSGSQGNMSVTSPMSTSSSPMHVTDDYINLTNAILGEAYLSIMVQPMDKFRFRYRSEMVGTHGSLLGVFNGRKRSKSNVPTVKLHNFLDKAIIRCTLVTTDEDLRIPHAHRLVRREDFSDVGDPHYVEVSVHNDFTAEFSGMGIIHTAKRNVKDELVRKLHEEALEERRRTNINAILSFRDEAQIKADAEQYQKSINLNSVALCFQGFIQDEHNVMRPITAPVYSNSVNNLKSALTGELKICRIDKFTSSCDGSEEVFILVEKVSKKNIKIKFFELDEDDTEIWVDYGRFSELDVHHQFAVVFRTPPYRDRNITSPREVFIQLERPSDSACSEPIKFTYKPSDRMIGRKRTRVSHSTSAELAQVTLDSDPLLMSTPFMNMPSSNDSTEISKEIKKMLDDRCSSSEFRNFVENINLDLYEKLLYQSGEDSKLTYDSAPPNKKEDDKLFAKDIINDVIRNIKMEPHKAKEIIINSLKNRTTYGDSPLHCALRYGQKDIVRHILMLISTLKIDAERDELVNIQNSSGKIPLHYAASQDQPEVTKALLMLGADPNIADHCGQMPLHRAVKFPEARDSVNVLLAAKEINIEANTDLGWSPLQLAAKAGSYHTVCSLIKAGVDVNSTDMSYGRTALHVAVEGGHKDTVEFLLKETKIDVNKRNHSGNTALHIAVVTPGTRAKEICALLLKYGADPRIRNYNSEPAIAQEEQTQDVKTEVEDENIEECTGQSSLSTILLDNYVQQIQSKYRKIRPKRMKINDPSTSKASKSNRIKKYSFQSNNASALDTNFVKFPYEPDYQPQCVELTKEYIDEINSGEVTSEGLLEQLEDRNEDYTEYLEDLEETSADPTILVPETIETLDNSDAQLVIQDTTSEQDVMQQDLDNYVQQIQSKYRKIRPKRMKINDPSTSKASKSNRIKKSSFQSNNASALNTNNTVANPVLVTNSSAPGTLPSPVKGQGGAKNSDAGAEQVYLARESKSIQLFFDSMAQTVKKLPPKAQADIKMHICKLVTEAEVRYSGQSMPQSTQQFIAPPGMIPKLVLIPCNMIDNQNAKN